MNNGYCHAVGRGRGERGRDVGRISIAIGSGCHGDVDQCRDGEGEECQEIQDERTLRTGREGGE